MERSHESERKRWKPSTENDPVTVDIEDRLHISTEIDTRPANIERLDTYDERIGDYKARGYTYIPIPGSKKYYNTEEGWMRNLSSSQFIDEDTHLMEVLRLLQEEPFLLVDYESAKTVLIYEDSNKLAIIHSKDHQIEDYDSEEQIISIDNIDDDESKNISFYSIGTAKDKYPNLESEIDQITLNNVQYNEDRYGMITLADVNRRGVKIMIYVALSGLVSRLSNKIEEEYQNSESVFKHLRAETIGRWHKDRMEGIEIHVAEHMNLIEIMQTVQASNRQFVKNCGFNNKEDVESLNSINQIRNRVMHANRSLIYDRRDIQDITSAINKVRTIVSAMD